jgi:hypothetical protein
MFADFHVLSSFDESSPWIDQQGEFSFSSLGDFSIPHLRSQQTKNIVIELQPLKLVKKNA